MSDQKNQAKGKCPECGIGVLSPRMVDEVFEFDLGDEKIEVRATNVPVRQCDHCAAQLSGPEAAKVRHEAVCRAAGFLTPQEIKALRQQLGLSQEELARIAGLGVATISRMECGRVLQNRSSDNLLYLLAASKDALHLLESRRASHGDDCVSIPFRRLNEAELKQKKRRSKGFQPGVAA